MKKLEIKDIRLIYHTRADEITAIDGLSFDCNDGEFVAIIGPSGCGKTTVLSLIAGLLKPSDGEIRLNGKEIKKCGDSLGYMLQKDHLFPWRTIEQNVFLPLEIQKKNTPKARAHATELLEKYGLGEFKQCYPAQLSGGMRQRAALIRTLAADPDLLLLDEPFSALDYQTRLNVCEDVYRIIKEQKKTSILVTHDISEAISLADRIVVLTPRPARVKNIHEIKLDGTPLERRESPEFGKWFERLWKELHQ